MAAIVYVFPNFQNCVRCEAHSLRRASIALGTDNARGQISPHIFAPDGGYCLVIPSSTNTVRVHLIFWGVALLHFGLIKRLFRFNKTIIKIAPVGYEIMIANLMQWPTLRALLAIYDLKSNREQLLNIDFINLTDHIGKS